MSDGDSKLLAVLKGIEAAEHTALQEQARIAAVLEERVTHVRVLREQEGMLERKLEDLVGRERFSALHAGNLGRLRSLAGYSERLASELKALRVEIASRENDVQQAEERYRAAGEEVVSARVDRKRVEKLLGDRELERKQREVQKEELEIEELTMARRTANPFTGEPARPRRGGIRGGGKRE